MEYFKIEQTKSIEKAKNIDRNLAIIYAPFVLSVSRQLYHLLSADFNLGAIFLNYAFLDFFLILIIFEYFLSSNYIFR